MSAHAMLHQKDNCVRSLERKSKNVPNKEIVKKQAKCPKCGHINTTDCQTECPECSIIYSQYQLVVKKAFDNTLAIIGRNGLETAGEELNALAIRYPSVKVTCDQYSAFIDHAIKKHLAGNNELARDYLDRLVKKHPVLKDSVANFFKEKEGSDNNDISSELTRIVTEDVSQTIDDNKTKENKRRALIACSILFVIIFTIMLINKDDYTDLTKGKYSANIIPVPERRAASPVISAPVSTGYTEAFLIVMNEKYGNVCKIETSGIFSRTLKVDWTQNTNKLYAMKVFSEIGEAKNRLYEEGVRYFQFPNDSGTYNLVDWKTGEKSSISDQTPYFFRRDVADTYNKNSYRVSNENSSHYDIAAYCKSVAASAEGSYQIEETCINMEEKARIDTSNMEIRKEIADYCRRIGSAAGGSYQIMETCINQETEAKNRLQN